jgi:hypothetical protein
MAVGGLGKWWLENKAAHYGRRNSGKLWVSKRLRRDGEDGFWLMDGDGDRFWSMCQLV